MNDVMELIDLVEQRPALYLTRHAISALKSFIDGWMLRDLNGITNTDILEKLQKYVEDYYGVSGHSWDKVILLFSQDEHDALDNFFQIYNKVKNEREVVSGT